MKAETYLNAYKRAIAKKSLYLRLRQKQILFGDALLGIAVHNDSFALKLALNH